MKKRALWSVVLGALALLECWPVAAQNIPITWQQTVFTNQTTTARSVVVRNINQSSHYVIYCETAGGSANGTIDIEGSGDGVHYVPISNVGTIFPSNCQPIQAGGYWAYVTVRIISISGGATVSAWYSASTGSTSVPSNTGTGVKQDVVTTVPVGGFGFGNIEYDNGVKSAGTQIAAGISYNIVLTSMDIYNPNGSVVYAAVGPTTTLFGAGTVSGVMLVAVPATSSKSIPVPVYGLYFPTLYAACSTSATAAADPASGCIVTASYKYAVNNPVPQ